VYQKCLKVKIVQGARGFPPQETYYVPIQRHNSAQATSGYIFIAKTVN